MIEAATKPRDMKRAIRRAIHRIERQMDEHCRHRPDPVLEQEVEDLRETLTFIDRHAVEVQA